MTITTRVLNRTELDNGNVVSLSREGTDYRVDAWINGTWTTVTTWSRTMANSHVTLRLREARG